MGSDWFGLAASAAGGGMFGVFGTALGRLAGYFEARQQQRFEQSRWSHEADMVRLQMDVSRAETEAELDLAKSRGSWEGLKASLAADSSQASGFPVVDAIRALTRPALTLLLWVITTLVFFNVEEALRARIVETAVFAATAATLWWFGDRGGPVGRSPLR